MAPSSAGPSAASVPTLEIKVRPFDPTQWWLYRSQRRIRRFRPECANCCNCFAGSWLTVGIIWASVLSQFGATYDQNSPAAQESFGDDKTSFWAETEITIRKWVVFCFYLPFGVFAFVWVNRFLYLRWIKEPFLVFERTGGAGGEGSEEDWSHKVESLAGQECDCALMRTSGRCSPWPAKVDIPLTRGDETEAGR